ncbi:phosphoglucosamine mutase, partial [bacterium]|nr:phosphoglucosamine mutase [bacterium]
MSETEKFRGLMVGVSGIRGIVGQGLTPDVAARYAAAYGTLVGAGEVVVGRDGRPSGLMIFDAVSAGLQSVGCKTLDIGIVPTPTIQMVMGIRGSTGGVAITASHNPQEWNALKFFSSTSLFLDEEEGAQLRSIIDDSTIKYMGWDRLGSIETYKSAIDDHIKAILNISSIDIAQIRRAEFKIVADCVNGAGSLILPQLLSEFGCDVIKLNCEPNGLFPRGAEPLPQNLTGLCQAVKDNGADLGIAVDPDSDRLAMVDNTGNPIGEEYSLVIAADFIQSRKKGPMVCNVSTTRAMDDLAEKYGVDLYRTKVGEVHVAKKMAGVDAVIGGEGNGGVILPEV